MTYDEDERTRTVKEIRDIIDTTCRMHGIACPLSARQRMAEGAYEEAQGSQERLIDFLYHELSQWPQTNS